MKATAEDEAAEAAAAGEAAAPKSPVPIPSTAVSSAVVLADEYALIWGEPLPSGTNEEEVVADYQRKVFDKGQAALCLSGGGIRSAAFALGVLQALSRKKLLVGFHYQSTVSGGGYIGGWLQRWIAESGNDAEEVMRELGAVAEPHQVKALRENSNFITPRVGFASNDTWTALAISVRNIAINWLLFAPLFLLIGLVPNLFVNGLDTFWQSMPRYEAVYYSLLVVTGLLVAFAFFHLCRGLPSYARKTREEGHAAEVRVHRHIVLPLVATAVTGTFTIACDLLWRPAVYLPGSWTTITVVAGVSIGLALAGAALPADRRRIFTRDSGYWLVAAIIGGLTIWIGAQALVNVARREDPSSSISPAVEAAASQMSATRPAADKPIAVEPPPPQQNATPSGLGWPRSGNVIVGISAGVPESAKLSGTTGKAPRTPEMEAQDRWRASLLATLLPLLLLWSHLTALTIFAAFRRGHCEGIQPDADREWLARLTALKIKRMLAWAIVAVSTLLLFGLLQSWVPGFDLSVPGVVAVISAAAAVAGGRSTQSGIAANVGTRILRYLPLQGIIALATFIFVLALLMLVSRLEQGFAEGLARQIDKLGVLPDWLSPTGAGHWLMVIILVVMLWLFGRALGVNRFSLNGLYRNRLARAFLGGARTARDPQGFTGFDPGDNIRVHKLAPVAGTRSVLYPIVNVALNVTQSEKLAWQERKAEPFIFSPLYCGSGMLRAEGGKGSRDGAYVRSDVYGGNEADLGMKGSGVSLATAISISGAAASPNMGYHSSSATAFLMTLFNVRLGAWMPNPARCETLKRDITRSEPSNSIRALLDELTGATDDEGLDVYLSDGGHFENLGLYEMIRRRCRYIVLSDAGADPDCKFEDLGNAVRKIKIDLGIDIRFEELRISSRNRPIDPQYAWALGEILYPEGPGHLLYIKPSLFGRLPVDVRAYAEASATFPHESTGDQFFSESQFESYRRLGDFFADSLGKTDENGNPANSYPDVAAFFRAIETEHKKEKAGKEEVETRNLLKRVISSLGFGAQT